MLSENESYREELLPFMKSFIRGIKQVILEANDDNPLPVCKILNVCVSFIKNFGLPSPFQKKNRPTNFDCNKNNDAKSGCDLEENK